MGYLGFEFINALDDLLCSLEGGGQENRHGDLDRKQSQACIQQPRRCFSIVSHSCILTLAFLQIHHDILTGKGRDIGVGVTWAYMFIGTGMKTGTGMGTGTYSLFTPSSTSVDEKKKLGQ